MTEFDSFNLNENLLRGIYSYGWEKTSTIQNKSLSTIIEGKDVIINGHSGTGKTGAFLIGIIEQILKQKEKEQQNQERCEINAIILSPTKELAEQTYNVASKLCTYCNINNVLCIGGKNLEYNKNFDKTLPTIIIGTTGKLCYIIKNTYKYLKQCLNIKYLVIDEIDNMLTETFHNDLQYIINIINKDAQILFVSATIDDTILPIISNITKNPILINTISEDIENVKDNKTLKGIKSYYINCEKDEWKFDTIMDLIKSIIVSQCVIFVNTRKLCIELQEKLIDEDFTVNSIHGEMEQSERDGIMNDFRNGKIRILLSTDLIGRGIDVQQISLVINYELPMNNAQYIHRIGRTGRFGRKGVAINLIGENSELTKLHSIERFYNTKIEQLPADFVDLF